MERSRTQGEKPMPGNESGIVDVVRQRYGAIARGEQSGCGCSAPTDVAKAIGYSEEELAVAQKANLGLGCVNPLAVSAVQPGMSVLDFGSGEGVDDILDWQRVRSSGRYSDVYISGESW